MPSVSWFCLLLTPRLSHLPKHSRLLSILEAALAARYALSLLPLAKSCTPFILTSEGISSGRPFLTLRLGEESLPPLPEAPYVPCVNACHSNSHYLVTVYLPGSPMTVYS